MTSKLATYILNNLKAPYLYNLKNFYAIPDKDMQEDILSKYYGIKVIISGNQIYDSKGNGIYFEDSNGYWAKREYDSEGNLIYYENSDGVLIDNS